MDLSSYIRFIHTHRDTDYMLTLVFFPLLFFVCYYCFLCAFFYCYRNSYESDVMRERGEKLTREEILAIIWISVEHIAKLETVTQLCIQSQNVLAAKLISHQKKEQQKKVIFTLQIANDEAKINKRIFKTCQRRKTFTIIAKMRFSWMRCPLLFH